MNINLTSTEAINWQTTGMLLRILPEQPPDDISIFLFEDKGYVYFRNEQNDDSCQIKHPHSVGKVIGCRERYVYDDIDKKYLYKSDYIEEQISLLKIIGGQNNPLWRSSSSMPKPAIRKWIEITGVECKRVQEIDIEVIVNIIHPDWHGAYLTKPYLTGQIKQQFINWFNDTHAKPKAVKEKGKIVGYVCYPYKSYVEILDFVKQKDLYGCGEYKGLPLEVIPNPYILLLTVKECEKPC